MRQVKSFFLNNNHNPKVEMKAQHIIQQRLIRLA